MDIFPSTSGKYRRFFVIRMTPIALIGAIFLAGGVLILRAGSVITIADSPESTGKLTLTPTTIKVDGSSSPEINLTDVLEADFSEVPFQLNYYFGNGDKGNLLPPNWKGQDIGDVLYPGSVVVLDGTFTVSGSGSDEPQKKKESRESDALYFVGQPWTGNGEWTARVSTIGTAPWDGGAGLTLRDTLDASSIMFSLGAGVAGNGAFAFRPEAGKAFQATPVPMDLPIWLRLTRYDESVFAAISTDGKEWDTIGLASFKALASPSIGIYVSSHKEKIKSHKDKGLSKAIFDQVSLTPVPSSAQVLPPGVLLQSGSFIAGTFEQLSFDAATPDAEGRFRRDGKIINIPRSKIAAVIMLPITRSQIADMGPHVGLLMKNGDVMDGDFDSINGNSVLVNSVLLGITTYNRADVRGCFLQPVQAQSGLYTLRLHDGSIINAAGLGATNGDISIQEASGVPVDVAADEVAQFRAGPSQVQSLAELAWKATPAPAVVAPAANAAPVVNPPAATNAAPANAAPVANAVPSAPPPPVQSWEGPNQEQIMETGIGTTIDFPLTGKFRAMGVKIALSSDSPPNSQVTIRVLADGREVARTPPFKAGDQPRFMEVTIQDPKTVTLEADSIFAGPTKVLFIDPVAIRDN